MTLPRDSAWLQERLFRRNGRLSRGAMPTKINCFAISPIAYRLAKLAEKLSSAQRMKRTSPHIIAGETSSISNHDPIRRQICSAPCCTTRTSQSSIPNRIGIHEIVKTVNEKALMLLHAVSWCNTASSFLGRGKKAPWFAWSYCPSVADAFLDLYLQPVYVSSETLEHIERFIVVKYSRTCSANGVTEARK